jgi:hypothetical protein
MHEGRRWWQAFKQKATLESMLTGVDAGNKHMGPACEPALPALIASLSDAAARDWAAAALGKIGPPAKSASPPPIQLLKDDQFAGSNVGIFCAAGRC